MLKSVSLFFVKEFVMYSPIGAIYL